MGSLCTFQRRLPPITWSFAPLVVAAGVMVVTGLGGCDSGSLQQAAESESLLAVFSAPRPAVAAAWYIDPYDPDKRVRGGNLLANAPFGGEEVYLKMHAVKLGAPPADAPDPDPGVRGVAARALGFHGRPEHAELIIPLLKEKDRLLRLEAARTLQRLHNPKAIDPLIAATQPPKMVPSRNPGEFVEIPGEADQDVRAEAASALGQYAEPKVVQALIAAIDDDNLMVSRNAQRSLTTLTGQAFGEDQRAWVEWTRNTKEPFAKRTAYYYPTFERDRYWFEYIPLIPQPPNELPGTPAGIVPLPDAVAGAGGAPRAAAPAPAAAASRATPSVTPPAAPKPLAKPKFVPGEPVKPEPKGGGLERE